MPGRVEIEGQRVPATYLNFYFFNGALLVPTCGHRRNDRRALIWGLGSTHCLTQHQPRF